MYAVADREGYILANSHHGDLEAIEKERDSHSCAKYIFIPDNGNLSALVQTSYGREIRR